MNRPAIVAVPVRDEVERIAACLRALAWQESARFTAIVLAINNTSDGTAALVEALRPTLPVPVIVLERTLPPETACAGAARRIGMEHARVRLGGAPGVLLTTDADGIVPATWLADTLRHIEAGMDAVAGQAALHDADEAAIPERLRQDDALECAYADALDALDDRLDPLPWDPRPRHSQHAGASIAVTAAAYDHAGGMPPVPLGEDRAFLASLERRDSRIRHAPEIVVRVSGRTLGRAEGGMADTIRRRLTAPDPYLDTALEPAFHRARRAQARGAFRQGWHGTAADRQRLAPALAATLAMTPADILETWNGPWFGEGWNTLDRRSPTLARHLVPAAQASRELAHARALLATMPPRTLVQERRDPCPSAA